MDLRRLRRGEWLALAGALVVIASLFATWYEGPAGGRSGWEAFALLDAVLALVAAAGLVLAYQTATRTSPSLPVAAAVVCTVLSLAAVLLVAYRLLQPPGANSGVSLGAGAIAGLAGISVLLAGAFLGVRDETRGAEHMADVAVQERPAPPAAAS